VPRAASVAKPHDFGPGVADLWRENKRGSIHDTTIDDHPGVGRSGSPPSLTISGPGAGPVNA
jgi:hypothetical protein